MYTNEELFIDYCIANELKLAKELYINGDINFYDITKIALDYAEKYKARDVVLWLKNLGVRKL